MIKVIKRFQIKLNHCYVYIHRRISNNEVFYVGKGTNNRWSKTDRNWRWKAIAKKHGVYCEIVANSLNNNEACILEKKLITCYGRLDKTTGTLCNLTDGGEGVVGCNLSEETREKLRVASRRTVKNRSRLLMKKLIMDETVCFESTVEATNYLKDSNTFAQSTHVSRVANLKALSYKGHIFRWVGQDITEFYLKRNNMILDMKNNMLLGSLKARALDRVTSVICSSGICFKTVKLASEYLVSIGKAKTIYSAKACINANIRGEVKMAFGEIWQKL